MNIFMVVGGIILFVAGLYLGAKFVDLRSK